MSFRAETASAALLLVIPLVAFLRHYRHHGGWPKAPVDGELARTLLVDALVVAMLAWAFLFFFETPYLLGSLVFPAGLLLLCLITALRKRALRKRAARTHAVLHTPDLE